MQVDSLPTISQSCRRTQGVATTVLLLLTLFLIAGFGRADAARAPQVLPIEMYVPDAESTVLLTAYLQVPEKKYWKDGKKPPLVILLHQLALSSANWGEFPGDLNYAGMAVLRFDHRGFGKSLFDLKQNQPRPLNNQYASDKFKMPGDVGTVMRRVFAEHADKIDTSRVGVIGAELGGTVGLCFALNEPLVRYVAVISPGMEHLEYRIAPALREFGDRPLLLAYADQDLYAKETVSLLVDIIPRHLDVMTLKSIYPGQRLVNSSGELRLRLIEDVKRYLLN